MLSLKKSKDKLLIFQKLSAEEQREKALEIAESFKVFFDSDPTVKEIEKYMKGITLFP